LTGTFDRNLENNELYISPNFKRIIGINEVNENIDFETYMMKFVNPDDRKWVQKEIINHIEGNSDSYNIEYRIIKNNNETGWSSNQSSGIWNTSCNWN